jgi:hypothetical protein
MKLTIDLNDPKDCSEAISLITQFHGTKAAAPKQDERNPPPPVDEPTYLPEDEQEAPVEDKPSGSGPTSEPEPEVNGVTREQLQALIKSHLKKFQSGSPEMDAEKKALIDLMLKTTETASSFTAPEDKLGAAFDAITAYMESK